MITDTAKPRRPRRSIYWALAGASLVTAVVSSGMLAVRIRDYNIAADRRIYYFIATDRQDFDYAGRSVTIVDELNDAGEGEVIVNFGDDELRLDVQVPNHIPLPGLNRHTDWMRLLIFAEGTGMSFADFELGIADGSIPARLVIVTREPSPHIVEGGRFNLEIDKDSWGWGEVQRKYWTFAFYEFNADGGFTTQRLRFPESGRSLERRQADALRSGEPQPERAADELHQNTWQFQAALTVMNRPPAITMDQQALRSAGWTLPIACISVLVLMFSIAWAIAPERVTEDNQTA